MGRAAPPRTRPETAAYLPASSLDSFLLPRGKGDRSRLNAALDVAKSAVLDDQMVLEGGCGPERVPLLENKHYPSCERYASALCSGGKLATYGAGEYQAPEFEAMRPMSEALYELGVAEWRRCWPWLSAESQRCPPDLCMCQRYDAWRGPRGAYAHAHATRALTRTGAKDARTHAHAHAHSHVSRPGAFMGMHTDMRTLRDGQIAASCGDVIGVSSGASMHFWFGASVGAEVAKERHAVLLADGDTWVWLHGDDITHK